MIWLKEVTTYLIVKQETESCQPHSETSYMTFPLANERSLLWQQNQTKWLTKYSVSQVCEITGLQPFGAMHRVGCHTYYDGG